MPDIFAYRQQETDRKAVGKNIDTDFHGSHIDVKSFRQLKDRQKTL